jgi:hypothetical protein
MSGADRRRTNGDTFTPYHIRDAKSLFAANRKPHSLAFGSARSFRLLMRLLTERYVLQG